MKLFIIGGGCVCGGGHYVLVNFVYYYSPIIIEKVIIQMVPNLVNLVDIQPNGLDVRDPDFVACEHRSTCAYAQFD